MAISAVSHAVRTADADPTGTGFPDDTGAFDKSGGPGDDAGAPPAEPVEKRPRRRLPLILGAVALTVGLVLGVVGAMLRGDDEPETTSPTRGPVNNAPNPQEPDGTVTRRPNPDLEIVIQSFDYDSRTMRLTWTDPAEGEGDFTLLRLDERNQQGQPIYEFPPGTTSADVEVDLALGPACFYMVVGKSDGDFGVSNQTKRCGTVTTFGWDPGAPG